MLPSIGPGWTQSANGQRNSTTWHVVWVKPANSVYGSESVEIYLDVELNQASAMASYQNDLYYLPTYGFTKAGAIEGLGDEATAYVQVVSGRPTFAVTWRDRNCEVLVYLASGRPPAPEVTMATTLAIAFAQGSAIDGDLSNYN